jgi:hypothetical protein
VQGFLYSGDDGGKLCKWTAGLMLEWVKDTYSGMILYFFMVIIVFFLNVYCRKSYVLDISSLAIATREGGDYNPQSFTASPVQTQVHT